MDMTRTAQAQWNKIDKQSEGESNDDEYDDLNEDDDELDEHDEVDDGRDKHANKIVGNHSTILSKI